MSAPTEPKKAKSGLAIVALVVAIVALAISIAVLGDVVRASQTTHWPTTNGPGVGNDPSPEPTNGTYVPSGPQVTEQEQRRFLAKGGAAVKRWGKRYLGKDAKKANIALAYLCQAVGSTKAGRYYAASVVDVDQFYGIGPYGTRRGDPAGTAWALCPIPPSWAQPKPSAKWTPMAAPTSNSQER